MPFTPIPVRKDFIISYHPGGLIEMTHDEAAELIKKLCKAAGFHKPWEATGEEVPSAQFADYPFENQIRGDGEAWTVTVKDAT